jgi:hypothetical protein
MQEFCEELSNKTKKTKKKADEIKYDQFTWFIPFFAIIKSQA